MAASRLLPHRWSVFLALLGAAVSAAACVAVHRVVSNDNRAILAGRAVEGSTVITSLVGSVQSALTVVTSAVAASPDPAAEFSAVAASSAGRSFSGLALLRTAVAPVEVTRHGSIDDWSPGSAVAGDVVQALSSHGTGLYLLSFHGTGANRQLGVLLSEPLAPGGYAVYAEVTLPAGSASPTSDPIFSGVDYALYLGVEDDAHALFASTNALPLSGTRAVLASLPGSTTTEQPQLETTPGSVTSQGRLLLVMSPRGALVGSFESALPWGLLGGGLLVTILFALAVEVALRRGDHAQRLAADLRTQNATLHDAREALARSEANYRRLFADNPEPMWVHDAGTGCFLAVNDAAVAQYGYARDEFAAMTVADLVPAAEAQPGEDGNAGPWTHLRRDGGRIMVEIASHPTVFEGRQARFVLVHDVTEQERVRHRVEQSQRLESLGQLAGGVAHDFNNLLSVILSYAQFAREQIAAADAEGRWTQVSADLAQVTKAGESAAQLTRKLLAFARRDVVRPRPITLNAVVNDVEQLLRRTLGEHVVLSTHLGDDLWSIEGDPGHVEQILVNLAVNSRDAMPDGGTLVIDTENLDVDVEYARSTPGLVPGRYVRLRVGDSGAGMTKEVLEHVFEPFFTTKPAGHGTGLGLATVYGIIGQMKGSVRVYSEPGVGTTFSALFPAVEAVVACDAPETAPSAVGTGTVLVVEDEEAIREVAQRILARRGYDVIVADTPREAIAIAADSSRRIDLLLTDVVMPDMLGRDVAAKVNALRPGIAVLFMSGYAAPLLAGGGGLDAGMALLEKPFSEPSLLTKVHEALAVPVAGGPSEG